MGIHEITTLSLNEYTTTKKEEVSSSILQAIQSREKKIKSVTYHLKFPERIEVYHNFNVSLLKKRLKTTELVASKLPPFWERVPNLLPKHILKQREKKLERVSQRSSQYNTKGKPMRIQCRQIKSGYIQPIPTLRSRISKREWM